MHIVSHRGSSLSSPRHPIHACAPVRCVVVVLFTRLLFLSVLLLFFQTFQMSSSEFHERLKSKDLRDFRLGTVASSDHETPLTWILWTKNTEIRTKWTWKHRVLQGTIRKNGRNIKTRCIGLTSHFLKRKDLSSIKNDRTQSSFTTHSQLTVPRRPSRWKLEKSCTRKCMRHLDFLRRFPLKTIGWKNWVQKLLEVVKTPNKTQPKTKQPNVRTVRLLNSCVPVFVERSDQDKDADENVDADQKERRDPLKVDNPSVCSHSAEEKYIDYRVSGLPHAVVKQAEYFRVRELVKKIESRLHRQALQADLQQNNAYNPFSDESKAMIRELCNAELFELCETIPKVHCSECFHYWSQGIICCTCGHLLIESESSQNFHQWWLDAFSIQNYVIKKDLVVLGTGKLRHRKSISWPTMRGRDVSKRILMEFTIVFNEIQYIVFRNSKLAGPRRSASRWTN